MDPEQEKFAAKIKCGREREIIDLLNKITTFSLFNFLKNATEGGENKINII